MRKKRVVGNWKMHGDRATALALVRKVTKESPTNTPVTIIPPFVYLAELAAHYTSENITFGAQDVSAHAAGAYTGEVAAFMLADIGCRYVLVGHSERRQYHHETDNLIACKIAAAQAAQLIPILCVGETLAERQASQTAIVVTRQLNEVIEHIGVSALSQLMIAYEPVWAIGTGQTATSTQAQEVHALLRDTIRQHDAIIADSMMILYGGSVKPANAKELFTQPDIDGGLIGGASLIAEDFLSIANSAAELIK